MKIYNGMWLTHENLDVQYPKQVYTYEMKGDKLFLYCPFIRVYHRGNTLDGGMLTVEVTMHNNNFYFEVVHNRTYETSKFEVKRTVDNAVVSESDGVITFGNEVSKLVVNMDDCQMDILYKDKFVTSIPAKGLSYITDENNKRYVMAATSNNVQEKIYGLGERFTEFTKNGQSVEIWNQDGGTDSDQTYKNIPFFVSTSGYGLFVDHSEQVDFELGSNLVSQNQFIVSNEELRFDVILNDSMKDVIGEYSKMTGQVPALPEWSYGLWLSTSFTTDYSEETVLEFIDGMIDRDLPFEVFHFDCFWMKEYEWTSFEWDKDQFADPKGLIDKIHARGKKVCVWINPYIGQKAPVFEECYKKGYFIEGENGRPWQIDLWQPGLAVIDFTNPEAVAWYQSKLVELMDMGVDSFKTDFGERIPVPSTFYKTNTIKYFDGSDPYVMHNYYTHLYNQAVYTAMTDYGKDGCLFARSGTVGGQQFPVHWGGDCLSNYVSQAESLRGGLSLMMSGYTFWSHDIGGFEAGCNPDIYKRWTQFGLLSSHSRYHGNSEYKVPWLYGDEAVDVTRKFTKLKNSLMPYFMKMEKEAIEHGYPMMRSMITEFEDDIVCRTLDCQYMLGDKLLVAPIFNQEGLATFYLPAGFRWYNILTEEILEGGKYYEQKYDYMTMPLFLKEGEVLITKKDQSTANFDCSAGINVLSFNVIDLKKETVKFDKTEVIIEISERDITASRKLDIFEQKIK